MKELSIEEKAKLYDEAIERAKIKRDEYIRLDGPESHVPQDIEFIFPVLKESEDEKIKKWIRKELESKYVVDNIVNNEMADKAFAWLEKRDEKTNPYSGVSFEYNGHIWGMCARDNGVDILLDKQLFKHLDKKQDEQNPTDKIIERAGTEKQRVLLTETNGDAHIDWDCRSLRDVKLLLKYGLEYIDAQLEKQGEKNESKKIEPWTAWIGKEGEKKPTDEVEVKPKFKVSDWIVTPDNEVKQIEKVSFGNYWFTDESLYDITDVDNRGHLWTIQDAKGGDVLYINNTLSESVMIYKSFNNGVVNKYASYNKFGFEGKNYFTLNDGYIIPATKEQRDLLFTKMKEAGYEWDAEKKELKDIDSPTWSEEDERTVTGISMVLQSWDSYHVSSAGLPSLIPQYFSWLNSIKDRILRKK